MNDAKTSGCSSAETVPDTCPHCHASLIGEPIPEHSREHFGGHTHFSRAIHRVHDRGGDDRRLIWQCPDCGKRWEA